MPTGSRIASIWKRGPGATGSGSRQGTATAPAAGTGPSSADGAHAAPDVAALARDLQRAVRGEVRFDAQSRAVYATDASNYRQVPIGVVVPRDKDDVVAAVAVCRRHAVPILGRGGGTSLAGQCCNVAVVLDLSKYMHRVLAVDPAAREATVEPGCVLDDLQRAAEPHGLVFGPDPATHDRCTLGGMIGNNSCGVHSEMSGRTADYVVALEVLTYDGARFWVGAADDVEMRRIMRGQDRRAEIHARLVDLVARHENAIRTGFPRLPRRVSGYNLDELLPERRNVARALVGTESTCVVVLEARVALVPLPRARVLVVVGWSDLGTLADHVPLVKRLARPTGLEAFDEVLVGYMRKKGQHADQIKLLPGGTAWMVVEVSGNDTAEAEASARRLVRRLRRRAPMTDARVATDPDDVEAVWALRESGLGATARIPGEPDTWPGWEDAAVPPERLGAYVRAFQRLLAEFGYRAALYGHFGQGCVHTRIPFDLQTDEGVRTWRAFLVRAADLVVAHGGSLSGEHGDGQQRAGLLDRMYGPELLAAMRAFKAVWDPDGRMNPGKVIDPRPLKDDLRVPALKEGVEPPTRLAFPDDDGRFSRAALRCVGVGLCRDTSSGVMCPSYMVTREEKHSTRGRARLLFEMMQGDVVRSGWQSEEVRDALDLCLSCKGCLRECPVQVDMATYKAEFLYHYHKHKRRPVEAYVFGYLDATARWGTALAGILNPVVRSRWSRSFAPLLGLTSERPVPPLARPSLQAWAARRVPRVRGPVRGRVVVFPDTFTNRFHPEVGRAVVAVVERAGFAAVVPQRPLCCGRPLYGHGMLDRAEVLLRGVVDALRPELRAGVPVVVPEPSCAATLRDEIRHVLPDDADAQLLTDQTMTLAEWLVRDDGALDRIGPGAGVASRVPALVQRHCHHQAVMGYEADEQVLDAMGVDAEILDAGCCGLAGSFGYQRDHYDVSMRIGERVLLPRARTAGSGTRVLADGFSCRMQVAHGAGRPALHLAQIVQERMRP